MRPGELEERRRMNLRLVTTDTGRAIAIRDHILPLLRQDGTVEVQRDVVRLTELRIRDWVFRFWTPFNELRARRETNESSASEERRNRIANALGATRARKAILGG
jgi:hypothetical protein